MYKCMFKHVDKSWLSWRYRGQTERTKLLVPYALLGEHLRQEKGVDLVGGGWVCSLESIPKTIQKLSISAINVVHISGLSLRLLFVL